MGRSSGWITLEREFAMSRYADLLQSRQIRDMLVRLSPVSKPKRDDLCRHFSNLPVDYLDFLAEIGYGVIGQRQYMVYDGVLPLSELLADACDPNLAHLLVFGDTTGGTCHAFNPSEEMRVTTIDLDTQDVEFAAPSFEIFIRTLLTSFLEE
jgi:hypothetical protein